MRKTSCTCTEAEKEACESLITPFKDDKTAGVRVTESHTVLGRKAYDSAYVPLIFATASSFALQAF
jgi:hypothetical protein